MKSKKLPNKSILACKTYSIIILESLRTIQIYASYIDKTQNKLKRNHSLQHGIKSKIASFLDKLYQQKISTYYIPQLVMTS